MKVAVVGATGLVGTRMMEVLAERNFPVTEFYPVASERSVGKEVTFNGKKYKVMRGRRHRPPAGPGYLLRRRKRLP